MITYSVKKAEKEGEEDSIVKTGHEHEFKMSAVGANLVQLEKDQKEVDAQIVLEEATMTNIREHNPFLADLTDEQIHACSMFYASKTLAEVCKRKKALIDEYITTEKEAAVEIEKQTGVKLELPVIEAAPQA